MTFIDLLKFRAAHRLAIGFAGHLDDLLQDVAVIVLRIAHCQLTIAVAVQMLEQSVRFRAAGRHRRLSLRPLYPQVHRKSEDETTTNRFP